jgi:hypothetical protein
MLLQKRAAASQPQPMLRLAAPNMPRPQRLSVLRTGHSMPIGLMLARGSVQPIFRPHQPCISKSCRVRPLSLNVSIRSERDMPTRKLGIPEARVPLLYIVEQGMSSWEPGWLAGGQDYSECGNCKGLYYCCKSKLVCSTRNSMVGKSLLPSVALLADQRDGLKVL